MRCPFFEEIIMAYCTACSRKKMIPKDQLMMQNPCEAEYNGCPIFKVFLAKQETAMAREVKYVKEAVPVVQEAKTAEKEKMCIWMKAGVIAYRMCTKNYDCKSCEFDQSLLDQSGGYKESPMIVQAIEKLRQLPASEKKCRYMLTGDFSYKICSNNYECWHCAVDQYVQDMIDADPYLQKRRERTAKKDKKVRGFVLRDDVFYLPNHVWIKVEGDAVKIGIDDFASRLIGKIDKIDFPQKSVIHRGAACWNIGSAGRMVPMTLPLQGDIVEINSAVTLDPSIVQKSPYNQGWLFKIKNCETIGDLIKGAKAQEWLEKEFEKLHQECEGNSGVAITDGGEMIDNLHEQMTDRGWHDLIQRFLW